MAWEKENAYYISLITLCRVAKEYRQMPVSLCSRGLHLPGGCRAHRILQHVWRYFYIITVDLCFSGSSLRSLLGSGRYDYKATNNLSSPAFSSWFYGSELSHPILNIYQLHELGIQTPWKISLHYPGYCAISFQPHGNTKVG